MRSDQTIAELTQPQALPAAPLGDANEDVPRPRVRALTRVAFCFAWLFGLDPFLTSSDDAANARVDRH